MESTIITSIKIPELEAIIIDCVNSCLVHQKQAVKQATNELEPLLTREEAAKHLKIDLSTLNRWTKKGTIQSYGVGNRVYYKLEDIKKALIKL